MGFITWTAYNKANAIYDCDTVTIYVSRALWATYCFFVNDLKSNWIFFACFIWLIVILFLLSKMIMKLLKFNGCSEMSLSHNLIIKSTTYNSRDFIFMNLMISTMRESSVYKSTIVVMLLLNNKQVSNVNDIIFSFSIWCLWYVWNQ